MPTLPACIVERFYNLNLGVIGTGPGRHERPHKPALLLAILALLDEGKASPSSVVWDATLRARFSQVFAAVSKANDRDTPENPFRYLVNDGFWEVLHREGKGPGASFNRRAGPALDGGTEHPSAQR